MKYVFLVLLTLVSSSAFALTVTTSMQQCVLGSGYGTGYVDTDDNLEYNRFVIRDDANGGYSFKCPVDMVASSPIERIEVIFLQDYATRTAGAAFTDPNDAQLQNYIPSCDLLVEYSHGGNDAIDLEPEKLYNSSSWNALAIDNPVMQHNLGDDRIIGGVLRCSTGYYSDELHTRGLRIYYQ